MARTLITIIGIGALLALSYQLLTHPDAATSEFKVLAGGANDLFITAQGR